MLYYRTITEPGRILGQQDLEIAQLIHARVQQLGEEMGFENLAPSGTQPLFDSQRNGISVSVHSTLGDWLLTC